jgi:hypothetical protein
MGGGNFFKQLGSIFKGILMLLEIPIVIIPKGKRVGKKILSGLTDIIEGIIYQFEWGIWGHIRNFLDIAVLFQYVVVYFYTNIVCLVKSVTNIQYCIWFYIIDWCFGILYLPITIMVYVLAIFRIPSIEYEKQFWDKIEDFDQTIYKYTKVHVIHYPKQIRELCYNCQRMKTITLPKVIVEYIQDLEDPLLGWMFGGILQMWWGVGELLTAPFEVLR